MAAGPSGSTPPSGTGMGKREAAFRQWAADMQARFDAGLEAEEDRAARRKDTLVVLRPEAPDGQKAAGSGSGGPAPAGMDHAAAQHRTRP